jgi:hypothetical protein
VLSGRLMVEKPNIHSYVPSERFMIADEGAFVG